MPEIRRLTEGTDAIELGFVERERTPIEAMKLGIQMHLGGVSLSDTVSILEGYGVDRSLEGSTRPATARDMHHSCVALADDLVESHHEVYRLGRRLDENIVAGLHPCGVVDCDARVFFHTRIHVLLHHPKRHKC